MVQRFPGTESYNVFYIGGDSKLNLHVDDVTNNDIGEYIAQCEASGNFRQQMITVPNRMLTAGEDTVRQVIYMKALQVEAPHATQGQVANDARLPASEEQSSEEIAAMYRYIKWIPETNEIITVRRQALFPKTLCTEDPRTAPNHIYDYMMFCIEHGVVKSRTYTRPVTHNGITRMKHVCEVLFTQNFVPSEFVKDYTAQDMGKQTAYNLFKRKATEE